MDPTEYEGVSRRRRRSSAGAPPAVDKLVQEDGFGLLLEPSTMGSPEYLMLET